MNKAVLFPATSMPDDDWWSALWPDPKAVLAATGIEADMSVVDLCCGNGLFTRPMCELVYPAKTWALDLDADLLAEAKNNCAEQINFHQILGDARELSKQIAEALDFVFIANTFHGIPNKIDFIQSVHQSLKSAGSFAIINWHDRPREETTVLGLSRGPETQLRMTPESVQELVEPVGFTLEKVIDVSDYHYASIFKKTSEI